MNLFDVTVYWKDEDGLEDKDKFTIVANDDFIARTEAIRLLKEQHPKEEITVSYCHIDYNGTVDSIVKGKS